MRSRNQPWVHASTGDLTSRISCFAKIQSVGDDPGGTSGPAQPAPCTLGDNAPALTDPHLAAIARE